MIHIVQWYFFDYYYYCYCYFIFTKMGNLLEMVIRHKVAGMMLHCHSERLMCVSK